MANIIIERYQQDATFYATKNEAQKNFYALPAHLRQFVVISNKKDDAEKGWCLHMCGAESAGFDVYVELFHAGVAMGRATFFEGSRLKQLAAERARRAAS